MKENLNRTLTILVYVLLVSEKVYILGAHMLNIHIVSMTLIREFLSDCHYLCLINIIDNDIKLKLKYTGLESF